MSGFARHNSGPIKFTEAAKCGMEEKRMKLEKLEDLTKAVGGLAAHFKKTADFHKAAGEHHTAMAEACKAHGEMCQAKHDGMDDGDANKAYFGKAASHHLGKAAHHAALAELHKGQAAHSDTMGDAMGEDGKAAAAKAAVTTPAAEPGKAPVAGGSVESMVAETTHELVKNALEMVNNDPSVKEEIRKMVLHGVKTALGEKVVPDGIHLLLPDAPDKGTRLVQRAGGPDVNTEGVDPMLKTMIEA